MQNKLVWITGASGGIGEAMAKEFAKNKAKLVLSARRKEELERVAETCQKLGAKLAHVLVLDMTDALAISNAANDVLTQFGSLDILVNNAGISQRSLIKDTDTSVIRKVMEVDFFGAINLSKALLPSMIDNGGGQVVVTSSLVGKFATPYRSGYSAAKHALHGFFEALRAEHFDDNIAVTILCPGFIHTNISVNSVTGDGSPLNEMDQAQANGMSPELFAQKALNAIKHKKPEAVIGGKERFSVLVNRLFPNLFRKIIRKAQVR